MWGRRIVSHHPPCGLRGQESELVSKQGEQGQGSAKPLLLLLVVMWEEAEGCFTFSVRHGSALWLPSTIRERMMRWYVVLAAILL